MKKTCLIACILTLCLLVTSCGYTIVDTSKIEDYATTFDRAFQDTELDQPAIMKISTSPSDGEIVQYYAKCIDELPLGERVQILLSVKYNSEAFEKETERISAISQANPVLYDTEHFQYPAYVSSIGYLNACEYVLVDSDNSTLHYVVLQSVLAEDIVFDASYLPSGYTDYGEVEGMKHTIYYRLLDLETLD
ncbi:MAG: hypothetical protein PUC29_08795 [Clostridia bacterium]|nr:hypothetical protein [Clostridia bacterium]